MVREVISRRELGAVGVAAGVVVAETANAQTGPVMEKDVSIKTADGTCDAVLLHP